MCQLINMPIINFGLCHMQGIGFMHIACACCMHVCTCIITKALKFDFLPILQKLRYRRG